jgi:hypothetical protein
MYIVQRPVQFTSADWGNNWRLTWLALPSGSQSKGSVYALTTYRHCLLQENMVVKHLSTVSTLSPHTHLHPAGYLEEQHKHRESGHVHRQPGHWYQSICSALQHNQCCVSQLAGWSWWGYHQWHQHSHGEVCCYWWIQIFEPVDLIKKMSWGIVLPYCDNQERHQETGLYSNRMKPC